MSIAAIIAEYNPFHTGHAFQIQKTRELTGCDKVIVIMSGDYVQRGEPAIMDKYVRTRLALMGGADAVLEMPVWISTASAQDFAYGCVKLLDRLGCVDYLSFGSEDGNMDRLLLACDLFSNEPEGYRKYLKEELSRGCSFPRARKLAYEQFTGQKGDFLDSPNNILGISYLMALRQIKSRMKPVTILREQDYHSESTSSTFASAAAIRKTLLSPGPFGLKEIEPFMVDQAAFTLLLNLQKKEYPVSMDDFWLILKNRLLQDPDCSRFEDMSEALNNRLKKVFFSCLNYSQLTEALKTEGFTAARIRRALLHVTLGITKELCDYYKENGSAGYIRVLGIRKASLSLLSDFSKMSTVPVITGADVRKIHLSASVHDTNCSEAIHRQNKLECYVDNLFESVKCSKFENQAPIHEKSRRFIIL